MSIATEITRLQTAKSNIKTAIENKGVTVPSVTTLSGYNDLIGQIENINKVSSVPSTKSSDIIYNTSDSSYYLWDELSEPLCFTANTAGSTVTLGKTGTPSWSGSYSMDGTTWNTYTPGTTGAITLANVGDKVYFKGDITNNFSLSNHLQFSATGSIAASGNCNSIYTSTNFENLKALVYQNCFSELFHGCTYLTVAPLLPATTLSADCYANMFAGCTSLIASPNLPATTLANSCYFEMFIGCSSLTTAPSLPAVTLAPFCYSNMFYRCEALAVAPTLPATTLDQGCYSGMFRGCTSLQVNDSSVSGVAEKEWRVPTSGTFTNTYSQSNMFTNCAGTRASNDMAGAIGASYTYYTQNTPV